MADWLLLKAPVAAQAIVVKHKLSVVIATLVGAQITSNAPASEERAVIDSFAALSGTTSHETVDPGLTMLLLTIIVVAVGDALRRSYSEQTLQGQASGTGSGIPSCKALM